MLNSFNVFIYEEIRQEHFLSMLPSTMSNCHIHTRRESHSPGRRRGNPRGRAPPPGAVSQGSGDRSSGTRRCGMRTLPPGRNSFLTPGASAPHGHVLITSAALSRPLVKCCPWSIGTIPKSRDCFEESYRNTAFFFLNIHGRYLELWPGVQLPYGNKPLNTETWFLFLCCWDLSSLAPVAPGRLAAPQWVAAHLARTRC